MSSQPPFRHTQSAMMAWDRYLDYHNELSSLGANKVAIDCAVVFFLFPARMGWGIDEDGVTPDVVG